MIKLLYPFKSCEGVGLIGVVFMILFLGITATGVMMVLVPSRATQQNRETLDKINLIQTAIKKYVLNHGGAGGSNPANLTALVTSDGTGACLVDNNQANVATYLSLQGWCGPYLDQIFQNNLNDYETDGWGTLMQYSAGPPYVLKSCGPDRVCPTADDITYGP